MLNAYQLRFKYKNEYKDQTWFSERRGLQPLPRGPADVNVSEKHVLIVIIA